eukprot:31302-Pelagococcus_subviridis.AAC.5
MSSSVWFANSSDSFVASPGWSLNAARITCSIGVIPVPPAIMPTRLARRSSCPPPCDLRRLMAKTPRPRYSNRPFGPWKSIVSPTFSACMRCDTFPPSGNLSHLK